MSERLEELSLTISNRIGEIGLNFSLINSIGKKVGSIDKTLEELIDEINKN